MERSTGDSGGQGASPASRCLAPFRHGSVPGRPDRWSDLQQAEGDCVDYQGVAQAAVASRGSSTVDMAMEDNPRRQPRDQAVKGRKAPVCGIVLIAEAQRGSMRDEYVQAVVAQRLP
jgi:hypothetical protein